VRRASWGAPDAFQRRVRRGWLRLETETLARFLVAQLEHRLVAERAILQGLDLVVKYFCIIELRNPPAPHQITL
jgi:hypothetical protein